MHVRRCGTPGFWPEIIAHLDLLTETEIERDGKRSTAPLRPAWP
jgi:hypothetical protein